MYHIDDRVDGHDDDEGSARSWPSRTSWGASHALAEKFPFLFDRFMWITEYGYRFGYTSAQIDLMVSDQPLIDYNASERKGMGNTRKDVDEMDALSDAWNEKNGGGRAGNTFSLSGYLRTGKQMKQEKSH